MSTYTDAQIESMANFLGNFVGQGGIRSAAMLRTLLAERKAASQPQGGEVAQVAWQCRVLALGDLWTPCSKELHDEIVNTGTCHGKKFRYAARALCVQPPQHVNGNGGDVQGDPAVAAIQYAISAEDGLTWLRLWNEGEFKICRSEWPDAPEDCYIGADPLLPATSVSVRSVSDADAKDAAKYRRICAAFDDMKSSTSEQFLDCLFIEGNVLKPFDELFTATIAQEVRS